MLRVDEKMGAAAVDEEDELLLVFWRLAGGAVAALLVPVVCSVPLTVILKLGGRCREVLQPESLAYICKLPI